jgi:hypothetical protein
MVPLSARKAAEGVEAGGAEISGSSPRAGSSPSVRPTAAAPAPKRNERRVGASQSAHCWSISVFLTIRSFGSTWNLSPLIRYSSHIFILLFGKYLCRRRRCFYRECEDEVGSMNALAQTHTRTEVGRLGSFNLDGDKMAGNVSATASAISFFPPGRSPSLR